jgi:hypothetical protein
MYVERANLCELERGTEPAISCQQKCGGLESGTAFSDLPVFISGVTQLALN